MEFSVQDERGRSTPSVPPFLKLRCVDTGATPLYADVRNPDDFACNVGADPRTLDAAALEIMTNEEVIAVNQDQLAAPARLVQAYHARSGGDGGDGRPGLPSGKRNISVAASGASGAGIKLKMEPCQNAGAAWQQFAFKEHDAALCTGSNASAPCVTITAAAAGKGWGNQCVTVLSERWPWWVSLLPCDLEDSRQFWTKTENGKFIASRKAVETPWPSGGSGNGKCVYGRCIVQGCLEIEGANPEVDQCDWSTNSSQFIWDYVDVGVAAVDAVATPTGGGGGQLRSRMSGQCLSSADSGEVYTGPLVGGRHTAVLLNRRNQTTSITLDFASLWGPSTDGTGYGSSSLPPTAGMSAGASLHVRDILLHKDIGTFSNHFTVVVPPHAVAHLVLSPSSF